MATSSVGGGHSFVMSPCVVLVVAVDVVYL